MDYKKENAVLRQRVAILEKANDELIVHNMQLGFYVAGEQKVADWLARTAMTRMGWFTPPFDTADDVKHRLEPYYDILDFHVEGAMLYFRARKR